MSEEPKNGTGNNNNNDENKDSNEPLEVIEAAPVHQESSDTDHKDETETPSHIYSNAAEPEGYSKVSTTANTKRLMLIGIIIFAIIGLYFVFFSDFLKAPKEKEVEVNKIPQKEVEKAISEATPVTGSGQTESSTTTPITTTEVPPLAEPTLPEPPPPPEAAIPETPEFNLTQPTATPINVSSGGGKIFGPSSDKDLERIKAKRAEKIMVMGGGGGAESTAAKGEGTAKEGEEEGKESKEDKKKEAAKEKSRKNEFLGFGDGKIGYRGLEKTSAAQVQATAVGDMNNIIAQGKIIAATLETAINTDIPGMLRAIIARDVYSEAGKRILIPKGSRAIGEYEPEVKNGQTRINVIWNRIITPSGIDIALTSPGTDELGRAGIKGNLDNKFWTRMLSAVMISFVIPLIAYKAVNKDKNPQEITNESVATDGTVSVTTTTDTKNQLLKQSIDKFSEVATEIVKSSLPEKPTITVPQGEKINIFVNKDLVFPDASLLLENKVIK